MTFGRTKRASYNRPHRTLAAEQRIIFILKSSCLKYSGLEESLPLVANGRGRWGGCRLGKEPAGKILGPHTVRAGGDLLSVEQGLSPCWGFISLVAPGPSALCKQCCSTRGGHACRPACGQSPYIPSAARCRYRSAVLHSHPTPSTGCLPPRALQASRLIQSPPSPIPLFSKIQSFMYHPSRLWTFPVTTDAIIHVPFFFS